MTITEFLDQLRAVVPESEWDKTLLYIEEVTDCGSSIETPFLQFTPPDLVVLRLS